VSARIAGACNAVRIDQRGRLIGDMFDGEGFVRGLLKKGANWLAQRRWSAVAAASDRRSRRRSPRPASPGSDYMTRFRAR